MDVLLKAVGEMKVENDSLKKIPIAVGKNPFY